MLKVGDRVNYSPVCISPPKWSGTVEEVSSHGEILVTRDDKNKEWVPQALLTLERDVKYTVNDRVMISDIGHRFYGKVGTVLQVTSQFVSLNLDDYNHPEVEIVVPIDDVTLLRQGERPVEVPKLTKRSLERK